MEVIAHTMEYRGGPQLGDLPVQPYTEDAYEEYRDLYNRCFRPMRQALGRYPLDCCPDRAALRAEQIFLYRHKGALAGAVTIREREIDGLIVSPGPAAAGFCSGTPAGTGRNDLPACGRLEPACHSPLPFHGVCHHPYGDRAMTKG